MNSPNTPDGVTEWYVLPSDDGYSALLRVVLDYMDLSYCQIKLRSYQCHVFADTAHDAASKAIEQWKADGSPTQAEGYSADREPL